MREEVICCAVPFDLRSSRSDAEDASFETLINRGRSLMSVAYIGALAFLIFGSYSLCGVAGDTTVTIMVLLVMHH